MFRAIKVAPAVFVMLMVFQQVAPAQETEGAVSVKRLSTGVVVPDRSVVLSAKIQGRIFLITRDEGEEIKKGDLLIAIEDAEFKAELKAAEAALGLAKADSAYKDKVEKKMKKLFGENSISEDMLDQAELNSVIARENIKKAEAAVDKASAMLRETRIEAPFDSVVIKRHAEIGQMTVPGQPLLLVEDHSRLKFRTSVKESDIPHIKTGQKVKVAIDALGGEVLAGTVDKIIPSGDVTTHTFEVEVLLPGHKGLYVGMFGKADFSR